MVATGGAAFPRPLPTGEWPPDQAAAMLQRYAGMSLRDFFAAHALVGLSLAACIAKGELLEPTAAASAAYRFADDMLVERDKAVSHANGL